MWQNKKRDVRLKSYYGTIIIIYKIRYFFYINVPTIIIY